MEVLHSWFMRLITDIHLPLGSIAMVFIFYTSAGPFDFASTWYRKSAVRYGSLSLESASVSRELAKMAEGLGFIETYLFNIR